MFGSHNNAPFMAYESRAGGGDESDSVGGGDDGEERRGDESGSEYEQKWILGWADKSKYKIKRIRGESLAFSPN